jgi:8-oxo-dGTP pyrophosphatase MutT (NUDIX family)
MARSGAKQIAALCWRWKKGQPEILLITSRETKRWVIPKGWPMDHLVDFNAAKTEAYEEAGVLGRMTRKSVGTYTYDKIEVDGTRRVSVTVYALEVGEILKKWPEKRERRREWFSVSDAAQRVDEEGLKKIIGNLATAQ